MSKPAEMMREIAAQLDPDTQGFQFRHAALMKSADIVQEWDAEMSRITAIRQPDEMRALFEVACMSVAKTMATTLTACMLYENEKQGAIDLMAVLAIMVAEMEDFVGKPILPTRDVIDRYHFLTSSARPDGVMH